MERYVISAAQTKSSWLKPLAASTYILFPASLVVKAMGHLSKTCKTVSLWGAFTRIVAAIVLNTGGDGQTA